MKMDLNSFFDRFFHRSSGSSGSPFSEFDERNENRDQIFYDDDSEIFDYHMNAFRQMEDMYNKVFYSSFSTLGDEDFQSHQSPRSIMMKEDSEQRISDLFSGKEENEGLNLSPDGENKSGKELVDMLHSFSYSKFASIRTTHLPDETMEEQRTIINSDDKKTTAVRRSIGDTSHEVITKSDAEGLKEKEENFMNMDENELPDFEQKWNTLRNSDPVETLAPSVSLPSTSPSYWYLFKKIFGPSQKDEVKWC